MSLLALFAYVVVAVLLTYLAIWIIGQLAPNHPTIIDSILWVVCVLVIVFVLLDAFGIVGPMVPRLKGGRP